MSTKTLSFDDIRGRYLRVPGPQLTPEHQLLYDEAAAALQQGLNGEAVPPDMPGVYDLKENTDLGWYLVRVLLARGFTLTKEGRDRTLSPVSLSPDHAPGGCGYGSGGAWVGSNPFATGHAGGPSAQSFTGSNGQSTTPGTGAGGGVSGVRGGVGGNTVSYTDPHADRSPEYAYRDPNV